MITSNLKDKGFRVEGETTLIKLPTTDKFYNQQKTVDKRRSSLYLQLRSTEDKYKLGKWVKTKISFQDHKKLKKLAIDKEITLAELLRKALKTLIVRMKGGEIPNQDTTNL